MTNRDAGTAPSETFSTITLSIESFAEPITFRRITPATPENSPVLSTEQDANATSYHQGHMALSLTAKLGQLFSRQLVYDVTCESLDGDPHRPNDTIPPIVVKLSRPDQSDELDEEAYYYQVLKPLQGVVVPRCWGLFQADIQWQAKRELGLIDTKKFPDYALEEAKTTIYGITNMLVLEKVGDPVCEGHLRNLTPSVTRERILSMCEEFHQLRFTPTERFGNQVLLSPSRPGTLPCLPSLYSQRVFDWRMVDFASAIHEDSTETWKDYLICSEHEELVIDLYNESANFRYNPSHDELTRWDV